MPLVFPWTFRGCFPQLPFVSFVFKIIYLEINLKGKRRRNPSNSQLGGSLCLQTHRAFRVVFLRARDPHVCRRRRGDAGCCPDPSVSRARAIGCCCCCKHISNAINKHVPLHRVNSKPAEETGRRCCHRPWDPRAGQGGIPHPPQPRGFARGLLEGRDVSSLPPTPAVPQGLCGSLAGAGPRDRGTLAKPDPPHGPTALAPKSASPHAPGSGSGIRTPGSGCGRAGRAPGADRNLWARSPVVPGAEPTTPAQVCGDETPPRTQQKELETPRG